MPPNVSSFAPLADYDLVQLHRLLLGRDPASDAELASRRGRRLDDLVREYVGSSEFRLNLQAPLAQGRLPSTPSQRLPAAGAAAWAAVTLPLDPAVRSRLAGLRTWPDLYAALFSDGDFRREIEGVNPSAASDAFAESCRAMAERLAGRALLGGVDRFAGDEVVGWALDRLRPETPMDVELWVDDRPAARTRTRLFRRDLQDAMGGSGCYGFHFGEAEGSAPRLLVGSLFEVRDAHSGVVLAAHELTTDANAGPGEAESVRRDLASLREALERLHRGAERMAPSAVFTLDDYAGWSRAYGVDTPRAERMRATMSSRWGAVTRISVLVSALDVPLDHAPLLADLERQAVPGWEAILPAALQHVEELASLTARSEPETRDRTHIAASVEDALETARGEYVLLLRGGDRLPPDALFNALLAVQAEPPPILLFGDDDLFDPEEPPDAGRSRPRLRTTFDPDLLLQRHDALGSTVLVRRKELLTALDRGGSLDPERRHDLQLRVLEHTAPERVAHIGGFIAHRRRTAGRGPGERGAAPEGRLYEAVQAHLDRTGSTAQVSLGDDPFRPEARRAQLRIVHPLREGTSATVIIPTRDRWDLLGPCLDSLERDRSTNATVMDVVVVDNGSRDEETLAELATRERAGDLRVIRSEGPFNFAALNNLAARTSRADLLVMLNNDIEVLVPGWLDGLARHALRSEIGAVGARLLYGDFTIQHAGVVTGGLHARTAHEGVGQPASSGGYLGRHALTRRVTAVTGACLATRRTVWERLGGLDAARFPVDGNDIDYCLRAWKAGLAVLYTPDATLLHHESKSRGFNTRSRSAQERGAREAERLLTLWGDRLREDPWYPPAFDRSAPPFTRLTAPVRRADGAAWASQASAQPLARDGSGA